MIRAAKQQSLDEVKRNLSLLVSEMSVIKVSYGLKMHVCTMNHDWVVVSNLLCFHTYLGK